MYDGLAKKTTMARNQWKYKAVAESFLLLYSLCDPNVKTETVKQERR
jgi:hypothetical protein